MGLFPVLERTLRRVVRDGPRPVFYCSPRAREMKGQRGSGRGPTRTGVSFIVVPFDQALGPDAGVVALAPAVDPGSDGADPRGGGLELGAEALGVPSKVSTVVIPAPVRRPIEQERALDRRAGLLKALLPDERQDLDASSSSSCTASRDAAGSIRAPSASSVSRPSRAHLKMDGNSPVRRWTRFLSSLLKNEFFMVRTTKRDARAPDGSAIRGTSLDSSRKRTVSRPLQSSQVPRTRSRRRHR